MKLSYLFYLLSALLVLGFYSLFITDGGFRLPVYYSPDGTIMPIGETAALAAGTRILAVNEAEPNSVPILFSHPESLSLALANGIQQINTVPNRLENILFDFKYFIAASFLFLFCAIWFYHNTRDIHLFNLNFIFGVFSALFVVSLAFHKLFFLCYFSILLLIPALLNMGLRTTGRYVSGYLAIAEVNFILFLSLLIYVGRENTETLHNLNIFLCVVYGLVVLLVLALQLRRALQKTEDSIERLKRWVLFFGTFMGIFLPLLLSVLSFLPGFSLFSYPTLNYAAFLGLVFPATLVYGTYRLQIIPFQLIFSKSLLVFLQGAFFASIYGLAVLIQNIVLPQQAEGYQWIVQVVFILTLIFFLDPLKYFLSSRLGKWQIWSEARLENSLQRIVSLITSHRRILNATDTLLDEVQTTLNLEKVDLLLSENTFPGLKLRKHKLIRIAAKSRSWKYLQEYHFVVTDYLTYGGGNREKLFQFLFQNNYMLAIGVMGMPSYKQKFPFSIFALQKNKYTQKNIPLIDTNAALLIGYRPGQRVLKISETHYLHESARLVNLLIHNYTTLIVEIQKRRRIRELQIAGQLQRKLPKMEQEECKGLRFAHSNQPAISVSGDYFDIITLKRNRIACFLGDVSGHGLGTGYLASSLRSIVRTHLQMGASLQETVESVNRFFMERYRGDEFLTLAAFIINTKSREMEYINAAHPGPYLIKADSDEFVHLSSFQPVMGVLPSAFHTKKIKMGTKDRLFLYSDGVTETFNDHNIPFGEKRLKEFIMQNKNLPLEEIIFLLERRLMDFRKNNTLSDDTTMAVLELSNESKLMNNLLHMLELRKPAAAQKSAL